MVAHSILVAQAYQTFRFALLRTPGLPSLVLVIPEILLLVEKVRS